jgi:hypothetical protein
MAHQYIAQLSESSGGVAIGQKAENETVPVPVDEDSGVKEETEVVVSKA